MAGEKPDIIPWTQPLCILCSPHLCFCRIAPHWQIGGRADWESWVEACRRHLDNSDRSAEKSLVKDSDVAQSCPTLCDPVDSPGSSIHRIFQARVLEWVAIFFSRGSSWPRDWTWVSCTAPGAGNGNPLQYSCLENSMDGGAWWATVHGVTKSWTQLISFFSLHFSYIAGRCFTIWATRKLKRVWVLSIWRQSR